MFKAEIPQVIMKITNHVPRKAIPSVRNAGPVPPPKPAPKKKTAGHTSGINDMCQPKKKINELTK